MEKRVDEPAYKIVDINEANTDKYDVLCLKSKKNTEGYRNKVKWVKERFKEGLRLKLLLVKERKGLTSRGFIEYIPSEYTWRGINAKGYMAIHCIWVVGQNKGHGYGTKLLEQCLSDAKGMNGVAVVTSLRTWLPKRGLFVKHGFQKSDSMPPDFELYAKRFSDKAPLPKFNPIPKDKLEKYASGITLLKSDQCPYTSGTVRVVAEVAKQAKTPIRIEHIESCKEAQNSVHPYGTFCILLNGKVLTYHPIGTKEILECLTSS
jgi:GNAT superfamily N-acetyltransferase